MRAPIGVQLLLGRAEMMIRHCVRILERAASHMDGENRESMLSRGATLTRIANELRELQ